jgi:hypothetical protein
VAACFTIGMNPVKKIIWGVAALALFGNLQAQESVIYRGFAELSQPQTLPQNQWTWSPGAALFSSLVPGTLRLLGVKETSRQIQAQASSDPLQAYQGKKVQFFWEGQWREATVLDAARKLFMYENRILNGLPGVIAYPDTKGFASEGPSLTFRYQGSGLAALTYVTRGVSWNLYYTLEKDQLIGWATLDNRLGERLQLGTTELVAGEVPLVAGQLNPSPKMLRAAPAALMDSAEASFVGEASGLLRYKLPGGIVLEPGLTELPFIQAKVTPVYTWRYQGGFDTNSQLSFVRGYRFKAPTNLAGGIINLRDQGVFIGQASMPDTTTANEVNLTLGPDPDGRAQRRVESLAKNRFRISTTVKNPKTYALEVEIQEFLPQPFTLEGEGVERLPEGYRTKFVLEPGQSKTVTYTVTFTQPK